MLIHLAHPSRRQLGISNAGQFTYEVSGSPFQPRPSSCHLVSNCDSLRKERTSQCRLSSSFRGSFVGFENIPPKSGSISRTPTSPQRENSHYHEHQRTDRGRTLEQSRDPSRRPKENRFDNQLQYRPSQNVL